MQIDNKQIIVVGASRGLGRGIAVALAGAGARVLAIGRDEGALEELRRQSQGRVEILVGEATDPSFVARVLSAEDPDGVFIVLGATPVMRPIHEYRWESFGDVWNTDVKATFYCVASGFPPALETGSEKRSIYYLRGKYVLG